MKVRLKEKREIAKETLYLEFDLLGQELNFEPGQFFQLTLLNPTYSDERGNSRYLGFANNPTEKETISTATRYGTSAFKKSLLELPIGTETEIGSIGGHGILNETEKPKVLIAGGIGVVPFMSILRYAKTQSLADNLTLIYANKNRESAVFFDELENMAKENNQFKFIPIMLHDENWTGEKNRIDQQFIKKYFENPNENLYFVTGAQKFVLPVFQALKDTGIDASNITIEIFTGY